ncbi:MAG: cysteine dioxygenase family protein [archaeon]|nr:MAG: cysteine dioxygenase family protein [archaeon]
MAPPYGLKDFAADAERELAGGAGALGRLKPLLQRLVQGEGSIPAAAFLPRKDRFAMNLLHLPQDKSFSIIGGVWTPGQTTPIHDHLTWAMVGVYEGKEREALFRRMDDGKVPGRASLELVSEKDNEKGNVTVLGEAGIHRVDNPFPGHAYSIHVYGRDIGPTKRHSYDPETGEVSKFVSGYCNVLRDEDIF